jgi:hypothetical protein
MVMAANQIAKYKNGNYEVEILSDGTKIRTTEDNVFTSDFPESIDVKITNYCSLGCAYCHENSTVNGKHADLEKLMQVIDDAKFPEGIELAIGGGNPLDHPHIMDFLIDLKSKGFIPNITVNQSHVNNSIYRSVLSDILKLELIKGLGISINSDDYFGIKEIAHLAHGNIVYHVISGINNIKEIDSLIELGHCKILVLGYKQFGRGINYFSEEVTKNIKEWNTRLPKYFGKCIVSFDNLSIDQLNIRRWFTQEGWDKFYMGDDFTHTMYIDAVRQNFAPTSRSENRKSFNDTTLIDYFQNNKGTGI